MFLSSSTIHTLWYIIHTTHTLCWEHICLLVFPNSDTITHSFLYQSNLAMEYARGSWVSTKHPTVKPQGMMWSFTLQLIIIFYNTLDSVTCFLYGMTYKPKPLSNVIPKALTAHPNSDPTSSLGMCIKGKYSTMSLVL